MMVWRTYIGLDRLFAFDSELGQWLRSRQMIGQPQNES